MSITGDINLDQMNVSKRETRDREKKKKATNLPTEMKSNIKCSNAKVKWLGETGR